MVEKRKFEQEGFESIENPFAQKPRYGQPKAKLYEKPDPSKKVVTGNDVPIKVNKTGQYNLNFIDWNNEWEAVLSADPNEFKQSPIAGMSRENFEKIYDEYFNDEMQEAQNEKVIQRLDTKLVTKAQKNVCAICLVNYNKGDKVFVLGCSHHFHTSCIEQWLLKKAQCPACRFDLE